MINLRTAQGLIVLGFSLVVLGSALISPILGLFVAGALALVLGVIGTAIADE